MPMIFVRSGTAFFNGSIKNAFLPVFPVNIFAYILTTKIGRRCFIDYTNSREIIFLDIPFQ